MNSVKRFFKEIKRVVWQSHHDATRSFIKVIIFVTLFSLIIFGLAMGLEAMWTAMGVGIHGK